MIPRIGEVPQAGQKYVRRIGAYALLPRGRALLLTCQSDPDPDLQLPGGGIDPGESPIAALHREVFEETGWRISRPRRIGAYRRFTYMPEYDLWAEKICLIYTARPSLRIGPPTEAGHQALWLEADIAARVLGSPGDREFARAHAAASWGQSKSNSIEFIRNPERIRLRKRCLGVPDERMFSTGLDAL